MTIRLADIRRRLGSIAIATWFGVMVLVGAGLLAKHLVALPTPKHQELERSLGALRTADERGRWLAVHVLSSDCLCSKRVAEHLVTTVRPAGFAEIVLWVGEAEPPPDVRLRFDVRRVDEATLAGYGIQAAPLLVAVDPAGRVRYAGGYTTRKQGPEIDDLRLLRAAQDAPSVDALPLFGCAVSERLKQDLSTLPSL
jgi:hypothetical protein